MRAIEAEINKRRGEADRHSDIPLTNFRGIELRDFAAEIAITMELATLANKYTPVLKAFDRFGHRIDEVEFHPAWHELMQEQVKYGIHSAPWAEPKPGAHVARAAGMYIFAEIENGTQCPISMTYGSVPSLQKRSDISSLFCQKYFRATTTNPSNPSHRRKEPSSAWA